MKEGMYISHFLDLCCSWRWGVSFSHLQLYSQGNRPQYPLDLNNVSCEATRHFWNKKRKYLKDKINELAMNSKNKNIGDLYRGIYEFKCGYQPRSNLVNDEVFHFTKNPICIADTFSSKLILSMRNCHFPTWYTAGLFPEATVVPPLHSRPANLNRIYKDNNCWHWFTET
jgi:hypothetical protein